jgi:hypothetical protein
MRPFKMGTPLLSALSRNTLTLPLSAISTTVWLRLVGDVLLLEMGERAPFLGAFDCYSQFAEDMGGAEAGYLISHAGWIRSKVLYNQGRVKLKMINSRRFFDLAVCAV